MNKDVDVINEIEIGETVNVFQWDNPYYYIERFKVYTGKVLLVDLHTRRLVIRYKWLYIFPQTKSFIVSHIDEKTPKVIVTKNYNRK